MRTRLLILFVAAIMTLAAAKMWAGPDYGPKYWSPTEEVVTPHIKWAKPDAQGPMKVLFIVSRAGMREVVELAQRMELNYTVFAVGSQDDKRPSDFLSGSRYDPDRTRNSFALTQDLKAKLDGSYDLIAMGNVNWKSFPLIIRYRLLKKVKEGTSLVGFVAKPDEWFKRATAKKEKFNLPALVPFKGLQAFAGYKDATAWVDGTVDCFEFGKGKILALKGIEIPPLQAFTPGPTGNLLEAKLVEYDYYLAWMGHLMRFAAGRTAVRVAGNDYIFTNRCDLTSMEYSVSGPADKTVTCAFTLRNDDNQITAGQEKEVKLSAAGTAVKFDVPRAPAGRYFADVWVKEGGKTLAFGSSFVELTGDPLVETIELKTDYRREEKVAGKIRITARKAVDGLAPAGGGINLLLRQRDTHGRVTAESRVDVTALQTNAAQEVKFELSGANALTIVQYLEVELRRGDEVLDRKKKAFSISNLPPPDDIRLIGWFDGWPSYSVYPMCAVLANAGFDTQYGSQPGKFSEIPPIFNIQHIPYTTRLMDNKKNRAKDDHERSPCLTDPEYQKKLAGLLTKIAEKEKPFSVTEFSLGDECAFSWTVGDFCFSPTCVAGFHKFLESEYKTLEAMNREYGTQYKAFSEVQPVTLDEARKNHNLQPLWVDYRRHMESTWAGIFPYSADVVHKIVPSARIGYEGSDTQIRSHRAADHYKLMKSMLINGTYDGAFVPYAVMSFARPGTLLGLGWYGGYNSTRCPEHQRYIAWRHLFRGANSFWVWTSDPCNGGSVVAPDLSLYDFFKANAAELREIKNGIGKLLMTAQRADDGVAILYSASSVHVSTLTEGLPAMEEVLNALPPLFEDTGHQFRIISYEQAANGELKRGGYRLLWMPYVQALSPKEAAEIEAFVREGGTVIADLRPGVRDEHGKPYEGGGILDKVFGVKQAPADLLATNCAVNINLEGYAKTLKSTAADLSVGLGTGKAYAALAGEKPALIINRYEKGKAILLNFSISAYAGVAGDLEESTVKAGDDSGEIRELFKALMAQAGVEEPVKVEPEIAGLQIYRFVKDGLVYIGALQKLPESSLAYQTGEAKPLIANSAVLQSGEKRHVYDARAGKYLGYTDRIKASIVPAQGMLFALLPYEVKGIKLNAPERIEQGKMVEYEAALEGVEHPGLHVFHVELVSSKGESVSYYAENVVGENGKCKGSFPLALNEATGKWKIRIKDAATGVTAEQTFMVEERK